MNKRRIICNVLSTLAALFTGVLALLMSIHYLAPPHSAMDWVVQLSGAATVGIIIFFLVWGHFQDVPQVPPKPVEPVKPAENKS